MSAHTILFFALVAAFLVTSVATGTVYIRRVRRLEGIDEIGTLLQRLVVIDREKLAEVAEDFQQQTTEGHGHLEPWQVWELTGGMQGLEALSANCSVLIDLACYVQRWYPEALPIAEQLRLNAREIQWHLERLRGAELRGNLDSAFPDYAQPAASLYCGMTQGVLALFEVSQVPGFARLQAAL